MNKYERFVKETGQSMRFIAWEYQEKVDKEVEKSEQLEKEGK